MGKHLDPASVDEVSMSRRSEELIDAVKLASMLSVSARTLYRLRRRGYLPSPIQLGGSVRWRLAEIELWIAEGCPKVRGGGSSADRQAGS